MKNDLICGKNVLNYLKLRGMKKLLKKSFTDAPVAPKEEKTDTPVLLKDTSVASG